MSTDQTTDIQAQRAETRGAVYALLANVFRYPDEDLCKLLDDPLRWVYVRKTAADLDASLSRLIGELEDAFTSICAADQPQDALDRLREDFQRLFGHTAHGRCPSYEMEYGKQDIVQQSPQLADISGFYNAFGLQLADATSERIDHVSVECEFMAILGTRAAEAVRRGFAAGAEVVADAEREFLTEHLGRWAPSFARRVIEADGRSFYGAAAGLLLSFLEGECRRVQAPTGPSFLEVCPRDPEKDVEFSCGIEENVPGGGDRLVQLGMDRD
ncbi:MAG: molecular chaperone TorD family protein [Phycisphaerales bacterium]|nr:molecular chaperone TorD family protein [Phycisphaerales bacterium]